MTFRIWYLSAFCSLTILTSCNESEKSTTVYETDTNYIVSETASNSHIMPPPSGGVTAPAPAIDSPESDFQKAGRKIDEGVDATGRALDNTGKAIDRTAKKVGHDIDQGYKNTKADIDTAIDAVKGNKKNR